MKIYFGCILQQDTHLNESGTFLIRLLLMLFTYIMSLFCLFQAVMNLITITTGTISTIGMYSVYLHKAFETLSFIAEI